MVVGLEGRPLTRREERRIIAQTGERQSDRQSIDTARHYAILNPVVEFTALFVLGILGGSAAIFIALFML